MQNLLHAYHVGTPKQVKEVITSWEVDLNSNVENEELPVAEWEPLLSDLGHTRGRQTLFNLPKGNQVCWPLINIKSCPKFKQFDPYHPC